MKRVVVLSVFTLLLKSSNAQLWKEWFRQKKTQIEYLVNQIGALKVYIELAQKGYKVVDDGLTMIGNIKTGDFNLHNDFFTSLKNINPKIRNYTKVADIISLQVKIVQVQSKAITKVRQSDQLSQKEVEYIVRIYTRLLEQIYDNVESLTVLITANNLELTDDERIQRIDLLHQDMQEKHEFAQWFSDQANILVLNRKKEIADTKIVQGLNGGNN